MEDSQPMPLGGDRRQHRKLVRFDPTISSGTVLQVLVLLIGFATAYGTYTSDRATTRLEIEQIKASAVLEKSQVDKALGELKADVREVQKTVTSVDKTVTGIKAGIDAGQRGNK